jgi:hypothetical protein
MTPGPPGSGTTALESGPPGLVVQRAIRQLEPDTSDYPAERPANGCDFLRPYRGRIGAETRLTIRPQTAGKGPGGQRLTGWLRYDGGSASIELDGVLRPDGSFSLQEKGAGALEGVCSAADGVLRGTYKLKGKSLPFELQGRDPGEAALHQSEVQELGFMPSSPACAGQPRRKTPFFFSNDQGPHLCFPEAKDRKLSYPSTEEGHEVPTGVCSLRVTSLQVFGLASPEIERAVNGLLGPEGRPWWSPELRRTVKTCAYNALGELRGGGGYRLTFNEQGALGLVQRGGYFQHQSTTFSPESLVIDLAAGRRVELGELVTSEGALLQEVRGCLPLYFKAFPPFSRPEDPLDFFSWSPGGKPLWTLVPGGIALLARYGTRMESALEGSGVVLSFEGLLRAGVLKEASPLRRLWQGLAPAPQGVPTCTSLLHRNGLVSPR